MKSNASRYAHVLWDEVVAEVAGEYPDVTVQRMHVDAMAARMVLAPDTIDVVVASNLFADIVTDPGAALQGGLGLAASANVDAEGAVRTGDLGGSASTQDVADAVISALRTPAQARTSEMGGME